VTFKVAVDRANDDMPTDDLLPEAVEWCRSIGSNANKVTEILKEADAEVYNAIQVGIDKANEQADSNASRVKRWKILPVDISLPTGELGPTLKLKRFEFDKKYENEIENFYSN